MLPFDVDRRRFLRVLGLSTLGLSGSAGTGGAAGRSLRSGVPGSSRLTGGRDPFTLGVASGDPASDGFVIWTRLAPDPVDGGGMPPLPVRVRWEVFADEGMRQVVRSGSALARPALAHAVHVELRGLAARPLVLVSLPHRRGGRVRLDAAARCRWRTRRPTGCGSPSPRASTTSRATSRRSGTCRTKTSRWSSISATTSTSRRPATVGRGGTSAPNCSRSTTTATATRSTRADADLQAAHAACPWIVTWDDHEVANNYAGAEPREAAIGRRLPAPPRRRLSGVLRAHAAAASLAAARSGHPAVPRLPLRHAGVVLRPRHAPVPRPMQPCGDNTTWPCDEMLDPQATMLGRAAGVVAVRGHPHVADAVERRAAAGDGGEGEPAAAGSRPLHDGSLGRLRGGTAAAARRVRGATRGESRRPHRRSPQQLGERPARDAPTARPWRRNSSARR